MIERFLAARWVPAALALFTLLLMLLPAAATQGTTPFTPGATVLPHGGGAPVHVPHPSSSAPAAGVSAASASASSTSDLHAGGSGAPSASASSSGASPATHDAVGPCSQTYVGGAAYEFTQNVNVSFDLFDSAFTVPHINTVSDFAQQVLVNISTGHDIPIQQAVITAWAVWWNNASANSTLPSSPAVFPMKLDPTNSTEAYGQLSSKFFPPGSTVYFNITVVPSPSGNYPDEAGWYSPCPVGSFNAPWNAPLPGQPTWAYEVSNGWPSANFLNDFTVTASPDVWNGVQPDPFQSVYFYLNSTKIGIPIGGPSGGANVYYTVNNHSSSGGTLQQHGLSFCSNNASFVESCSNGIPFGIGPFYVVGDTITYWFEAWTSNLNGAYNYIWSTRYSYTVSSGATFCSPDSGYIFYGWSGSALPPYDNPAQQNGNYTGSANPAQLTLNGPATEIALYTAEGSAASPASAGAVAAAEEITPAGAGVRLSAPTSTEAAAPAGPGTVQVTFTQTGLLAGSVWSVLFNTTNTSSTLSTITFNAAPGDYAYTVTSPLSEFHETFERYVATSNKSGTVAVGASPVNIKINFQEQNYLDIIQNPWNAGMLQVTPATSGANADWFNNGTLVNISTVGYFGFPYFVTLSAGHSVPFPMEYVVQSSVNISVIPAFTGILNLSIGTQNATSAIAYAYVFFTETYNGETLDGQVPMNEINSTSFYTGDGTQLNDPSDLGPYAPGVNVTFHVAVTDELGCTINSPTYHFRTVKGPPPVVNGRTYFYVVVYDQSKNQYQANVPVNISNNTWWDLTYTNVFGFAYPNASNSPSPLFLAYGWYNITVTYSGHTQNVAYDMTPDSNKTLTFIFFSGSTVSPVYSASTQGFTSAFPYFPLALFLGMVAAGAILVPLFLVWAEQRRKAAAEEKRITL